jgi:hypothetical protein
MTVQELIRREIQVNSGAIAVQKTDVARIGNTIRCPGDHDSPQGMRKDSRSYTCPDSRCGKRILFGEIAKTKIVVIWVMSTIQCPDGVHVFNRRPRVMKKTQNGFDCTHPQCRRRVLLAEILNK